MIARAAIEHVGMPAPDFSCERCLNHAPFKLSDLRGKVVLVDFWEYTCINCIRTFPYLRRWDRLYRPLGLVIVGVHTPEFEFGKNPERVADATKRFGFDFPVAIDSDYKIWYAFHNEGWPADYLIDKDGNIVYTHMGEGEYGYFEQKIQELLKQANPALDFNQPKYKIPEDENVELSGGVCMRSTPETYLGFAHTMNIANSAGEDRSRQTVYAAPADVPLDDFALDGRWLAAPEYVRHAAQAKAAGGFGRASLSRQVGLPGGRFRRLESAAALCHAGWQALTQGGMGGRRASSKRRPDLSRAGRQTDVLRRE